MKKKILIMFMCAFMAFVQTKNLIAAENGEMAVCEEKPVHTEYYISKKTTERIDHEVEGLEIYRTNLTYSAYDPIGLTYSGPVFNIQFIVYVDNKYSGGLTFRKPVYYTHKITYYDSGAGYVSTLKSTGHFTGVWGPVGDPLAYGKKNIATLTTSGTSLGTKYTGITEYFLISMTNTCYFDINAVWKVKGGGTINVSDSVTVW